MIDVSSSYKEIMDRNLRNAGHMEVVISAINVEAHRETSTSSQNQFWFSGTLDHALNMVSKNVDYATYEKDYFRMDGTMQFLPSSTSIELSEYRPIVVKPSDSTLYEIDFVQDGNPIYVDLTNGLTFHTPYYNNENFTIEVTYYDSTTETDVTETKTLTIDSEYVYVDSLYSKVSKITITPTTATQDRYTRITEIMLGKGIVFNDEVISRATLSQSVNSLSEELPIDDFTLEIFDTDDLFDIDKSNSYTKYLTTEQLVRVRIGLELDSGNIEWLDWLNLYLDTWKATQNGMSFTAKNRFAFLDDTISTETTSVLFESDIKTRVSNILLSAGLEQDEFSIDSELASIEIENPDTETTVANYCQIMANAGHSILYQDNYGVIHIDDTLVRTVNQSDIYTLYTKHETSKRIGYQDNSVKNINITYYNYTATGDLTKTPVTVVWNMGNRGIDISYEAPMIGTLDSTITTLLPQYEQWLQAYYISDNNKYYDITFRGDPKLRAGDIVQFCGTNIYTVIESLNFTYNGAFSETMSLKKIPVPYIPPTPN